MGYGSNWCRCRRWLAMAENELDGNVCVVTGGGRGIGAAITKALVDKGARVAILEADPALAEEVGQRFREDGADVRSYHTDVTDEPGVLRAAEAVEAELG